MNTPQLQQATFAAGCFWGIEAAFRKVEGVVRTEVGYTGGHTQSPSYEQVCTGRTGHAEAVRVTYDPATVGYDDLLDLFWRIHDPTQVDRQGPDVGSQYRSAIFVHSPDQRQAAQGSRDQQQAIRDQPVATQIVDAPGFHLAEQYHQQYLAKRGREACASTIQA